MATAPPTTILDEVLDFLASTPTLEQIIAFRPSEALQARASVLLERNRSGQLSPDEQAEIEEFSRLNHFMSMLKVRARKKLSDEQ